jgi:hypothetical protein
MYPRSDGQSLWKRLAREAAAVERFDLSFALTSGAGSEQWSPALLKERFYTFGCKL